MLKRTKRTLQRGPKIATMEVLYFRAHFMYALHPRSFVEFYEAAACHPSNMCVEHVQLLSMSVCPCPDPHRASNIVASHLVWV